MNVSKLIEELSALKDEFGDLEVGIINPEFQTFEYIEQVYYRKSEHNGKKVYSDCVELGLYFIAID